MTCIILVRHGETDWNREEHFRGRADVPLNETGLLQAEATGRRIAAEWRPSAVYASPLSRSLRTAEAIARHFDLTVQAHAGLMDIDYGQWQGLTPSEVRKRWPEMADAWYHAPQRAQIPGGETLEEVRARALAAVHEMAARHAGQTLVLVSHTVVNRVILGGTGSGHRALLAPAAGHVRRERVRSGRQSLHLDVAERNVPPALRSCTRMK